MAAFGSVSGAAGFDVGPGGGRGVLPDRVGPAPDSAMFLRRTRRGKGGDRNRGCLGRDHAGQPIELFMVERDQGRSRLKGNGSIHRIGSSEPVASRKAERLTCQIRIQRGESHIGEVAQRNGKRLSFGCGRASPADRPSNFRKHEAWHDDRDLARAHDGQELAADLES